jgi:hypothetical protein
MKKSSNPAPDDGHLYSLAKLNVFERTYRALNHHFSRLGNPELIDPMTGERVSPNTLLKVISMEIDDLKGRLKLPADAVPAPSDPPSIGTVIRSLRETGRVDLSMVSPEDHSLTQRISMYGHDDEKPRSEGEACARGGGRPEQNPYDLMDDRQAMSHLAWNDGFGGVEPPNGQDPDALIEMTGAEIGEVIRNVVRLQLEQMSPDMDQDSPEKVLSLIPLPPDSDSDGLYVLFRYEPVGDGRHMRPVAHAYEEIGAIPNTVIQAMSSRGYLEAHERAAGVEYGLTPKALVEVGRELGYAVEATPDGPQV